MTVTTVERPRETAYISAYVPAGLRDEIEELARENERTLSGELRFALTRHVRGARRETGAQGLRR